MQCTIEKNGLKRMSKESDRQKLYVGDKPPSNLTLKIIERLFFVKKSPQYLGTIAVEIGYSLAQTQQFIDGMILAGTVRELTSLDRERGQFRTDGVVYSWVNTPVE